MISISNAYLTDYERKIINNQVNEFLIENNLNVNKFWDMFNKHVKYANFRNIRQLDTYLVRAAINFATQNINDLKVKPIYTDTLGMIRELKETHNFKFDDIDSYGLEIIENIIASAIGMERLNELKQLNHSITDYLVSKDKKTGKSFIEAIAVSHFVLNEGINLDLSKILIQAKETKQFWDMN